MSSKGLGFNQTNTETPTCAAIGSVHKQQGRQRLIVCAAGDLPLSGQHGQKCLHLGRAHVSGVAHTTARTGRPPHKKAHPIDLRFLGIEAIVPITQALPQLIEQAGGLQNRTRGFHGRFIPVFLYSIFAKKPVCKRLAEV